VDLARLRSVYAAAREDRLAWVSYPKLGQPDTDLHRDWRARAVRQYGVEVVKDVSVNGAWSALRLRPAQDGKPDTLASPADIDV
jgi:hypothetical protein